MTPKSKRQLAAILFADIVGYTALMQKDEQKASIIIRHFQQQLEEKVKAHNGKIVNFYGDGALCTFQIPIDAVRCATALQTTFQNEPKTPVRIGIHSGTVTYEGDKIFGDSVNITSRIESMGVAGGILLSKKVRDEVKNNPDLQMQSLGHFEFKNVEEPMEVYALTNEGLIVPKKENIQGKLKAESSNISKFWLTVPLLLLLAFVGYYYFQQGKETLPDEILESRIAIIPYENNTNDPNFDALGDMAADWIANSLLDLEDTNVVMYDNVKDHLTLLSKDQNAFANRTGAEQLIRGKFYQEGEELIFESKIINPTSNEVLYALPLIRGNKGKPSKVIGELSQRITGYFANNDFSFSTIPPTYEAFKLLKMASEYIGKDYDKAIYFSIKAIELDSTYLAPYNPWFFSYANRGKWKTADSIYQLLKLRFPNARNDIDNLETMLTGNIEKRYKVVKRKFEKDPKDFISNFHMGRVALSLNRPQITLDAYQQLNPTNFDFDFIMEDWWFKNYAIAYMQLKQFDEALSVLDQIPNSEANRFDLVRAEIYVRQDQSDSLELLVQKWGNGRVPESQILFRLYKIAYDYGAKGDKLNQMKWGKHLLNRIQNSPESVELPLIWLGNAYFITEDYENMLPTYEQIRQKDGETWEYLVHVGFAHAKLGNMEMVNTFLKKYQALENPYTHGRFKYAQAMIYAALGEKEEAMRFLRLAFKEGNIFNNSWDYNWSYELASLQGYPPFEEFVKPKG